MATTKEQIKAAYPLPIYNYKVEIAGQTIGFSEVSGLTISYENTKYAESPSAGGPPGPRWMYMPAQENPATITLKKGVVPSVSKAAFFDWINSIQTNVVEKRDIFVRLCDEEGAAVLSWKVINAFPTKLDGPSFSASSNDVAVESMELMADGVRIEAA
ncbi:MAG TPA: phage tail protein [Verrucomicrobiota bacterium]|nr:phage tail protein [Verrucomicrobiales bacterium]HRI15304.1 phage tail protein [Verrucomicrobiota bacterium]